MSWPLLLTRDEAEDLADVLQEWRELRFYHGGTVAIIDGWTISWTKHTVKIEPSETQPTE